VDDSNTYPAYGLDPAIVDDPENPELAAPADGDAPVPEEHELLLLMLELFRGAHRDRDGQIRVPGGDAMMLQLRARILLARKYPQPTTTE